MKKRAVFFLFFLFFSFNLVYSAEVDCYDFDENKNSCEANGCYWYTDFFGESYCEFLACELFDEDKDLCENEIEGVCVYDSSSGFCDPKECASVSKKEYCDYLTNNLDGFCEWVDGTCRDEGYVEEVDEEKDEVHEEEKDEELEGDPEEKEEKTNKKENKNLESEVESKGAEIIEEEGGLVKELKSVKWYVWLLFIFVLSLVIILSSIKKPEDTI